VPEQITRAEPSTLRVTSVKLGTHIYWASRENVQAVDGVAFITAQWLGRHRGTALAAGCSAGARAVRMVTGPGREAP
jgi:hypothetical protein